MCKAKSIEKRSSQEHKDLLNLGGILDESDRVSRVRRYGHVLRDDDNML